MSFGETYVQQKKSSLEQQPQLLRVMGRACKVRALLKQSNGIETSWVERVVPSWQSLESSWNHVALLQLFVRMQTGRTKKTGFATMWCVIISHYFCEG